MQQTLLKTLSHRGAADLLILPFWEGPEEAADCSSFRTLTQGALASGDFKGKQAETLFLYGGAEEKRILLLGLGQRASVKKESLRRAYAAATKAAQGKKLSSVNLLLPSLKESSWIDAIGEGVVLTNYAYNQLKSEPPKDSSLLERISWIGSTPPDIERLRLIGEGTFFIRDLVNGNADDVTPRFLAETAQRLQQISSDITVKLFDRAALEHEKMGLILAVSRASVLEPYLVQVSYRGAPSSKEHVVLVGKGVTYDTGGLSLKTTDNMATMKCDMAGAATVLGTLRTAAQLKLKVNITALVPTVENAIGSKAYKVGDVYRSYCGKRIEITNTDAEGRLVLADALSYAAQHLQPSCMIDLATLTGSIVMALGEDYTGLFASTDALAEQLLSSSARTNEALWRMPLHADYKERLKSDVGDMVNSASGREAGSITAALFLQEFVGTVPWAHLDIAGTAYITKAKHYYPSRATGFGLRLLIDFLEQICNK